jgi:hypothetical protein
MKKKTTKRQVTLDGMMTIGMLENSLRTADFECCEDAQVEAFIGRFKVQCMRDGNVYMEELPKRQKNSPLFRLEHSSLTLGRDGWFYFGFRLPESELIVLPKLLRREAARTAFMVKEKYLNRQLPC